MKITNYLKVIILVFGMMDSVYGEEKELFCVLENGRGNQLLKFLEDEPFVRDEVIELDNGKMLNLRFHFEREKYIETSYLGFRSRISFLGTLIHQTLEFDEYNLSIACSYPMIFPAHN